MILIGTIEKHIRKNIIQPAYLNYRTIDYDLTTAKHFIVQFLMKNYYNIPESIEHYKLNKHEKNKLRCQIKNFDDFSFIICVKTGKTYMVYY